MQLKSLLPAALAWAATTTSAMLVPPETNGHSIDAFNAANPADPRNGIELRVPCPRCPVATEVDGVRVWDVTGDKDTDILLEFSQRDNKIYLGKTAIYPISGVPGQVMGKQVKAQDSDDFDTLNTDLYLSTRMEIINTVPLTKDGLILSEFRMEVLGIEDKVVHVGTVSFGVFDHKGDNTVAMSEPKIVTTVTTLADAQCTTIICRIKAQMIAKMTALKAAAGRFKTGCMRMMGMHPRPHQYPHAHQRPHEHHHGVPAMKGGEHNVVDRLKGGPHKFHNGMGKKPCPGRKGGLFHGHHHHGVIGKLAHGVAIFARHVLMPVLVGVAAGMAVSAFGMVVGQLFFMIMTRLRARRNGGYIAVYQVVDENDVEGGSEKYEEDEIDALPRYEAGEHILPPAYDEKKDDKN